jgi:beta-lactamase regulating signal transducer with metallopeptidase domain
MIPSLLEFALRALLVAAAVGAGLHLLRVREVLAQKAAWGLVLAAAILMPLLLPLAMRWQILPPGVALALPAHPWRSAAGALARAGAPISAAVPDAASNPASSPAPISREFSMTPAPAPETARSFAAPLHSGAVTPKSTIETPPPIERHRYATSPVWSLPSLAAFAFFLYLAVCAVLLVRLLFGLTAAIGLWMDAEPVNLEDRLEDRIEDGIGSRPERAAGLRLRASRAVSSPVTIGSGVVLPANFDEWESEKLRIVLAHERSHIRQGDFYLQLLAELYSALFWFSPLGWWLKRKLSDLGEAISDRAGLEEAASRSHYAQILLEFAAAPRPTLIGVAMARSSSLSHRIERLLNDSIFHQAFSVSRRRATIAVLLVPVALFAATSLIRVEASGAPQPAGHEALAALPAPADQVALAGHFTPADQVTPAAATQPAIPAAIARQSHPDEAPDVAAPVAPFAVAVAPVLPRAPLAPDVAVSPVAPWQAAAPAVAPPPPPDIDNEVSVGEGQSLTITNSKGHHHSSYIGSETGKGFAYSFRDDDGDSYALVTQPSGGVRFSGDWVDGRRQEIERAERMAHGKFLWFTHEGKSYVIDDPAIIDSIEAMYKPMDELGRQQEELGKKQEALGKQQEELGRRQEQASVPTPDISKELAALNEALAKLQGKKGSTITQDELGDIQSKIGDVQSKIGDIEGKIGEEQGRLGDQQGKLGDEQGKLGDQQGKLGDEQGRIAQEADRKVRSIIDQGLQNGKARPVE